MNEKELDDLAIDDTEELSYKFKQLNILKEKLDGVYRALNLEGNKYAATFLGVDIDELQNTIEKWNKPSNKPLTKDIYINKKSL